VSLLIALTTLALSQDSADPWPEDIAAVGLPTGGQIGEACGDSDDCLEGLFCLEDEGSRYCSDSCLEDDQCPSGYACYVLTGTEDMVCAVDLEEDKGGCSCASSASTSPWSAIWLVLALPLLRRRR
jgi:MYXO-CTERM domain-containing protein